MSSGIDPAIVLQFTDQFDHAFQQEASLLRPFVRIRTGISGSMAAFDVLGGSEAVEITGKRHSETEWVNPQSSRRWAVKRDFNHPVLLDWQDQLEILVDLQMGYARNAAMAMGVKADKLIIEAITGTAATGATGTTTSTLNTAAPDESGPGGGNIIPVGSGPMTIDKMRRALAVFKTRQVGVRDIQNGMPNAFVLVWSARQEEQILSETEATSRDFYDPEVGRRMPLVEGHIPKFMGMNLVLSEHLPLDANGNRLVLAWHRDAVGYAVWAEQQLYIDRIPTMNNATGVQMMMSQGGVRIQDAGVLAIACDETP